MIQSGGNPTVRNNRIQRNGYEAIWVQKDGRGTFEDNDLKDNKKGPWDIHKDALPHIKRANNVE